MTTYRIHAQVCAFANRTLPAEGLVPTQRGSRVAKLEGTSDTCIEAGQGMHLSEAKQTPVPPTQKAQTSQTAHASESFRLSDLNQSISALGLVLGVAPLLLQSPSSSH